MRTKGRGRRIAVVLAAGKGTRMRSSLPKVLHQAAGRPLLAWVAGAARAARCEPVLVVIGHGGERVREEMAGLGLTFVLQAEQRGTGHALAQVAPHLTGGGAAAGSTLLLVLSGDVPLVTPDTLERLAGAAAAGWGALAVADLPRPGALGRVLAAPGEEGLLGRIVEAADASPAELAVHTVNAGLYALPAPDIFRFLAHLGTANAKGELYLTDALNAAAADGRRVRLVRLADPDEALGVNTQAELARVHRLLLDRHLTEV